MKIEFELNKKEFKKVVIKEIARQILIDENNTLLNWDDTLSKILIDKAHKLLKEEPEFEKSIMKDLKIKLRNKNLITNIAKEILKENLGDN